MTSIAVVAHTGKSLGDGLGALRELLAQAGFDDPIWREVRRSAEAPAQVRRALKRGADLVFVWGGDGMVQHSIDTLVGTEARLAILPAGTANLLAHNLGIPKDLETAVRIGLFGRDRTIDVGRMNGEHFAVMAGVGLDSLMIKDTDRALKDRFGKASYVWTGARRIRTPPARLKVDVDGDRWFSGTAGCLLIGNVGQLFGGLTAFEHASPEDGRLDVAVMTADGAWEWARTLTRAAAGHAEKSPLVQMTQGRRITVRLDRRMPYEMDGGERPKADRLTVKVIPRAVTVRVPRDPSSGSLDR